ncbi:centrosomal protein 57 [Willisornis vidua]|uniref:Centrosomal protein 57 n=1 Tax=Willisornis vidua TaxID=1566151 RepID=A0ABQ9D1L9_9PASS|nr:centrosomal protein 57 [Willisornis vidua]
MLLLRGRSAFLAMICCCFSCADSTSQDDLHKAPNSTSATDGLSATSFLEYPNHKPFINSDLQRFPWKPVIPYPESNSRELASQLAAAESRCILLEKQLDYMRKMIQHAENEKSHLLEKQGSLERDRLLDQSHVQSKLEKLDMLEKEYRRLTTMQSVAELKCCKKFKLLLEVYMARGAATIAGGVSVVGESVLEPARIGSVGHGGSFHQLLTEVTAVAPLYQSLAMQTPNALLGAILLCSPITDCVWEMYPLWLGRHVVNDTPLAKPISAGHPVSSKSRRPSLPMDSSSSQEELSEVLLTLQDEFGQMSFDHQQLSKLIEDAPTTAVKEDLERELEALVGKMEAKADQINKLERLKRECKSKKASAKQVKDSKFPVSEVKVTTTVTTKGKNAGPIKVKPGEKSRKNLQLLRDMQTIQTSLQKDDISWDY